jgi:hypothetical protein
MAVIVATLCAIASRSTTASVVIADKAGEDVTEEDAAAEDVTNEDATG